MSKYTTQVRFICESKCGLENSSGCDNVDAVIVGSWDKIFTTKVTFFDEAYRSVLCQKILKHYYLREICSETVGVWKLWMNTRLEEIMPYYNQLYNSAKLEFDPLNDVNITRKHDRKVDGEETTATTSETTNNNTATNNTNSNNQNIKEDLYSDTPQGAITGLENGNYLTNARKTTDSGNNSVEENGTSSGETNSNYSENKNSNTTEDYLETLVGKQGGATYSKMLTEFRETLLNIDLQVIEEFSDLFFGLW